MSDTPTTSSVNIIIDETKLRDQMQAVVEGVMSDASSRLISAAGTLNPNWLQERDALVAAQAVDEYKRANGLA